MVEWELGGVGWEESLSADKRSEIAVKCKLSSTILVIIGRKKYMIRVAGWQEEEA